MRVLVCADSFEDGCAFYRSVGPWSVLAKKHPEIRVEYVNKPSWADVKLADVLFLQRPAMKDVTKAVNAAKQFGTKIIVDFDDDLFQVPRDNPAHEFYCGAASEMKLFLQLADLVMVSTSELKNRFSEFNKNIHVVPNAVDECLLQYRNSENCKNIVMWRGTSTHNRDVASVSKELVAAARKYPEYKFAFLGCDPCAWDVSEKMKEPIVITTPMTPVTFFSTICFLKPKIMIVPLHDIPFNRAKSNIAALEATVAGAAVLAPNWPEWSFPGVTTYGNATEFAEKLDWLMRGSLNPPMLAVDAWNHVGKSFFLPVVNELRRKLVTELVYPKG